MAQAAGPTIRSGNRWFWGTTATWQRPSSDWEITRGWAYKHMLIKTGAALLWSGKHCALLTLNFCLSPYNCFIYRGNLHRYLLLSCIPIVSLQSHSVTFINMSLVLPGIWNVWTFVMVPYSMLTNPCVEHLLACLTTLLFIWLWPTNLSWKKQNLSDAWFRFDQRTLSSASWIALLAQTGICLKMFAPICMNFLRLLLHTYIFVKI